MKKIALMAVCVVFLCSGAVADEPIEVPYDSDARALLQVGVDISFAILMPCLAQFAREMGESGKTDEEIAEAFSDRETIEELQLTCLCTNKDAVAERLAEYDTIMLKRPDWKGKRLVAEENGTTHNINLQGLEYLTELLSTCL